MTSIRLILLLAAVVALPAGCSTSEPRTEYSSFDDSRNEKLAIKNIRARHPGLEQAHINVAGFLGSILITGEVGSADLIEKAGAAVSRMRNVRRVHNELTVAGPTTLLSRTNDSFLSTKVKAALIGSGDLDASRIKVVTENGVVYLMGTVSRAEADLAVSVTQDVYGIQKIVKVFDYLN
ncbi:MAG: BON domain-containing protein [Proteobacteria bacterium]|nr:BON domain-containing protein [Pseudomonadota bacterium]